jgi:hypothetical protein
MTSPCNALPPLAGCSQLDQLCKDRVEVTFGAGAEDMKFQPESLGRRQDHTRLGLGKNGIGRVDEKGHDACRRKQLVQQLLSWNRLARKGVLMV